MIESTNQQDERAAQLLWTGVILSFFLIQAVIWTVAITLTARDKSHAVVSRYDERALNWDDEKALRVASARLGWQTELVVDSIGDIRGIRTIRLTVTDAGKSPVTGASLRLAAFHRGLAGDPQQIQFAEVGAGVYCGKIQVQKTGNWQFEGQLRRGDETFVISERQFIDVGN